ncbi:MAG: DUF4339 domain-containing protein [Verrucomicrobia bacterium]|nr:DUF4339 domain-containing protein [Verrucomicrobiota bacterium]
MQFYVLRDGKYEGPLPKEKVEEMLNIGQLRSSDLAFREGLSNWMPVVAALAARSTPPAISTTDGESKRAPPLARVAEAPSANSTDLSTPTQIKTPHPSVQPQDFIHQRAPGSILGKAKAFGGAFKSADWLLIFPLAELHLHPERHSTQPAGTPC